ncbi:MAG: pilus assembly protein PilP [Deltaproteobacteria bacterium]|nr:pilus assembly protein PilP [Deltaproteobacteria bacterium]
MARTFKITALAVLVPLVFLSCKKQEQPSPPPPVKKAPAAQSAPAVPAGGADTSAPADSTTDARNRNPFLSHILLMKGIEGPRKMKGPIECCDLTLFRLVAVVASPESSFALVQAPDGKRYVVKKGDLIGSREGRISRIEQRSITVREYNKDENGKVVSSEDIELKIPTEKESPQKR